MPGTMPSIMLRFHTRYLIRLPPPFINLQPHPLLARAGPVSHSPCSRSRPQTSVHEPRTPPRRPPSTFKASAEAPAPPRRRPPREPPGSPTGATMGDDKPSPKMPSLPATLGYDARALAKFFREASRAAAAFAPAPLPCMCGGMWRMCYRRGRAPLACTPRRSTDAQQAPSPPRVMSAACFGWAPRPSRPQTWHGMPRPALCLRRCYALLTPGTREVWSSV